MFMFYIDIHRFKAGSGICMGYPVSCSVKIIIKKAVYAFCPHAAKAAFMLMTAWQGGESGVFMATSQVALDEALQRSFSKALHHANNCNITDAHASHVRLLFATQPCLTVLV